MAKSSGGVRSSHSKPSGDFKEFRAYSNDWKKTYFDHSSGGYVVTHKERIESGSTSPNEKEKFEKEQSMCIDLAQAGHQIEHLSDNNRKKGNTYDIHFDGIKADLKSVGSHNNIEKYVRHAIRDQGAHAVIVRVENSANRDKAIVALRNAQRKYKSRIFYYFQSDKILREI
ncbi:MAG: hypothetical protein HDS43_06445 [Bacteroides sp.]|nr:hypothetical protein [Bacteroides sp.]